MIPGVAGTQTLPRLLGLGRAAELILTGAWLDARAAHRLGLVAQVVARPRLHAPRWPPPDASPDTTRSVRRLKRAVCDGLDQALRDGLALERRRPFGRGAKSFSTRIGARLEHSQLRQHSRPDLSRSGDPGLRGSALHVR
jgi:enoyl-CoA hydratase/carnithine racemase